VSRLPISELNPAVPRGDAGPEAPGRRPLDAKDIDRPNGRGYQHANAHAGKHQLDAGKDDMRAGQQRQPIAAGRRGETNDWLPRIACGMSRPGAKGAARSRRDG
jgi:hypothetical protein